MKGVRGGRSGGNGNRIIRMVGRRSKWEWKGEAGDGGKGTGVKVGIGRVDGKGNGRCEWG